MKRHPGYAMISAGLLLLLLAGCVDVEYVGQRFEPLPETDPVRIFDARSDYPIEDYRTIGRAVFTAPEDYGILELREKVENTAREYGADAVKVISSGRELISTVYRQPQRDRQRVSARAGTTGTTSDGSRLYVDTFGQETELTGAQFERYQLVIKVLLLMRQSRFEQLMAERRATVGETVEVPAETAADVLPTEGQGTPEGGTKSDGEKEVPTVSEKEMATPGAAAPDTAEPLPEV